MADMTVSLYANSYTVVGKKSSINLFFSLSPSPIPLLPILSLYLPQLTSTNRSMFGFSLCRPDSIGGQYQQPATQNRRKER